MQKIKIMLMLIMLLLLPKIVLAGISTERIYGTYEQAINIVQEVMQAYYLRGPYLQYNYAKSTYGVISPEDALLKIINMPFALHILMMFM